MPLARIDLIAGKSEDYRQAVGDIVYEAMVDILKAPKDDRFQVINEHLAPNFIFDPHFFGIERSDRTDVLAADSGSNAVGWMSTG
jgi:spore cortex formation protein SpoVR/YcgB (stage V sporulation)